MDSKADIYKNINTTLDRTEYVEFLEEVAGKIFENGINIETYLKEKSPYDTGKKLLKYISNDGVLINNPGRIQKSIGSLKRDILDLPIVQLYLAFEPSSEMVKKLGKWAQENLDYKILFNIHVDSDLIAGTVIESNGYRQDYSLSTLIKKSYGDGSVKKKVV